MLPDTNVVAIAYERITVALRDGTRVLGKRYKGELRALTYANRSQAVRSALHEGGDVVQRGRPFYVRITDNGEYAEKANT
jgi:hypothetical protein